MLSSTVILSALPLLALVAPTVALGVTHQHRDHSRMQRVRKARALNRRACKVRPSSTTLTSSSSSVATVDVNAQYNIAAAAAVSTTPTAAYVAPATTSSSYVAPAYTAPASSAGGKQGWASNNPSWVNNNLFKGAAKWVYNWSAWNQDIYAQLGIEFVPMLWGADGGHVSDFNQNVGSYKAAGVKYILGFNEPDQTGQSYLSPQDAANSWWANMSPHAGDFTLVGPALTASDANTQWYVNFMNILGNDAPNHVALHYYGTDAQDMINYIQKFAASWNYQKPVWVTEYACQDFSNQNPCTVQKASEFMATVTNWMNSQDYVFRHAWFGALVDMSNVAEASRLLNANGQELTSLGNQYFW